MQIPVILIVPRELVNRLRTGKMPEAMIVTPFSSEALPDHEIIRLLGPLGLHDNFEMTEYRSRWIAKHAMPGRNVVIWYSEGYRKQIEHQLSHDETVLLVSGTYLRTERDADDHGAVFQVVQSLLSLGGGRVVETPSFLTTFRQFIHRIAAYFRRNIAE